MLLEEEAEPELVELESATEEPKESAGKMVSTTKEEERLVCAVGSVGRKEQEREEACGRFCETLYLFRDDVKISGNSKVAQKGGVKITVNKI